MASPVDLHVSNETHFMPRYSGTDVLNVSNNAIGDNIAQGSAHQYNANAIYFGGQEKPPIGLAVAEDAPFNSSKNQFEPLCLSETRVEILRNIELWADRQDETYIFWLNGMAGTGKTTIVRTIARKYCNQKRLGASFFFSRGDRDVGHAGKFVASIASQLAEQSDALKNIISEAVFRCPNIGRLSFQDQWSHLILEPLSKLKSARSQSRFRHHWFRVLLQQLPKVKIRSTPSSLLIVIDALDECDDDRYIQAILLGLQELNSQHTPTIRVLLTSRPETPVRLGFHDMPHVVYQQLDLHDIPRNVVDKDISIFFRTNFKKMRDAGGLPAEWPEETSIMLLVQKSQGLFIYAAIVCRFVLGDEESMTPQNLLQIFLLGDSPTSHQDSLIAPTFQLDEMYTKVLRHSFKNVKVERDRVAGLFRRVIGSIVVLWDPLSEVALSELLCTDLQQVKLRLRRLHSVLHIPETTGAPIRIGHTSFRDFLLDKNRCLDQTFWVDERERHRDLFECCLRLLSLKLRKDILGMQAPRSLVQKDNRDQVEKHIPPEVEYACLYWIKHLQKSGTQLSDNGLIHQFLLDHLLHWLEALSWIGKLSEGISDMILLEAEITPANSPNLYAFVHDANRFALYNRSAIEQAPLQLYVSALIFAPEKSIVRRRFKDEIPTWIQGKSKVQEDWDPARQTLEGHSASVNSVAFSPDGKLVASASRDNTVRLWDAATGAARRTLEGHSQSVTSVAFSPDGKVVASASDDFTVRLWDGATGAARQTLDGHSNCVTSVAFSPDSKVVASASYDFTVRLWDTTTGAPYQTLEGHSHRVTSVAFSSDSKIIASASYDHTVRLWDAATGAARQTLKGHSQWVTSVTFSPDGKVVTSASNDDTVRLWDVATGTARQTLKGHSERVTSVAVSPDGKVVASASDDHTIRLWDAATGAARQTLKGHSHWVTSVAFSSDCKVIASASEDHTIRLWDAVTEATRQMLEDHSNCVTSVVFSPDGNVVASASDDHTVRLWDAATGAARQTLEGHSQSVTSVVFSPDGKVVASASDDFTARLWDAETGEALQTLEGHSHCVTSIAFSPDGKVVASASYDHTVRLWDTMTGVARQTLEGHFERVTSVAFSSDGMVVASASYDHTVRLWNAATGAARRTLELGLIIESLSFSSSGQYLDTDRGSFRISAPDASNTASSNYKQTSEIFLTLRETSSKNSTDTWDCFSVVEEWVMKGKTGDLWLPPDYRASCMDVFGAVVVLGHRSGRISLFQFTRGSRLVL